MCHPVPVWQAEEAVANLPLRLAVRVRCAQYDGVHARVPTRDLESRVLTAVL